MPYARNLSLKLAVVLAILVSSIVPAMAHPNDNRVAAGEDLFDRPPHIAMLMRFWEKVFQKYTDQQIVIHDFDHPEVVIDVVDFAKLERKLGSKSLSRTQREHFLRRYVKRYELALKRFAESQLDAISEGAMEERVYAVYSRNNAALASLLEGQSKLRTQTGLANHFVHAANIAQNYLPDMERIFAEYNVPAKVTRIAFVESMFNTAARSKVGASGIWQLMPSTARMFINVNHFVDERNSPLKATRAAAKLLSSNYQALGSWPLAITAYNHGAAGMARAQKLAGSSDIDQIIQTYRSPSFGFASKNFYAEFLAAANTYDLVSAQGLVANAPNRSQLQYIRLPRPMSLSQIVKQTKVSAEILRKNNPCLLPQFFSAHRNRTLPTNYEIAFPKSIAQKVKFALSGSKGRSLADTRVIR